MSTRGAIPLYVELFQQAVQRTDVLFMGTISVHA